MTEGRHPFAWSPGPQWRCWNCGQLHPWEQPCVGSGPLVREVGVVPREQIEKELTEVTRRALIDLVGFDPFAQERAELRSIEDRMAELYSDLDRVLPPLIERGEYWEADHYRARVLDRVRELECHWQDVRQLLPPFTTYKDGLLYRHPVTEENRHLLSPLSRVGNFRES